MVGSMTSRVTDRQTDWLTDWRSWLHRTRRRLGRVQKKNLETKNNLETAPNLPQIFFFAETTWFCYKSISSEDDIDIDSTIFWKNPIIIQHILTKSDHYPTNSDCWKISGMSEFVGGPILIIYSHRATNEMSSLIQVRWSKMKILLIERNKRMND